MYTQFWGSIAKGFIIIVGGFLGLIALISYVQERVAKERQEKSLRQYENELEREKNQLLQKIKNIGDEMIKDQRFIKLVKDVAKSAEAHKDELRLCQEK